ncbi:hypothetical protein TTHT_1462 [Thermotomaculum hydrothermale]|uniref:Tetratricopeptide TPR_1 repeat-containing protein n=1 Tax=Thermotomaculum hydrothermale TaxID=981385 RepID=A0A7R6SZL9_9BACT|nr:tetratricopeptide repeat protein [Thermotomaculum hydrothermale]BBB32970.1 hypothetical protein TTHT_1462 [Thermotomaculum hydrothermale]
MILKERLKNSKGRFIRLTNLVALIVLFFSLSGFSQTNNDLKIIKGLVRDGAFNIAKTKIETFLQNNPQSPDLKQVYSLYFDTLMATRDYTKIHTVADEFYNKFCTQKKDNTCFRALLFNAYAYYFENDFKSVDKVFSKIAIDFKSLKGIDKNLVSQYYLLKGDLSFKRDAFKDAISNYNSFLKLKFDNKVRLKLAISYYHYKKFGKAEKILKKLEKEGFKDPLLNRYLGLVYYGKKKYDIAYKYFSRNKDREDGFFAVHTLVQSAKLKEAFALFRQLIPLPTPTDEERTNFQLSLLLDRGDLLDASNLVEKKSYIEDKEFYLLSFKVFDNLRMYNKAVGFLRKYALVSDTHKDYFKLAEYYLTKLNDMDNALLFYNKCIEKNPEGAFSSIALLNRIKCTLYNGDKEKALTMLADFLKKYGKTSPVTDDAYFVYGKLMLDRGNYPEAIKSFENIILNYQDSPLVNSANYYLAESYFRNGMYKDTVDLIKERFKKQDKKILTLLALAEYLNGDFKSAVSHFSKLKPEGYLKKLYAYSLAKTGKVEEAKKIAGDNKDTLYFSLIYADKKDDAFNLALKSENPRLIYLSALKQSDENMKKLYLVKVLELSSKEDTVRKLALIELEPIVEKTGEYLLIMENEPEYIKNNPEEFHGVQGLLKKAEKYRQKGNIAKAVYFYKMAVENYPEAKGVDKAYYFLFETLKNPPVKYLKKIVETFPDSEYYTLSCYKLGLIHFNNKEYSKAADYFEEVLKHRDKNIEKLLFAVYYYLGICYEQTGQTTKAVENYLEYLKNLPQDVQQLDERIRIALFLQKNGKTKEALDEFLKILPLLKDEDSKAEVTFYIAECYETLGDLNKALENYLSVTYLHPKELMWSTTARFNAAKICEKLGYYDDAIKLYKKIADAYKGQVQGEFARKKLKELEEKNK